MMIKFKINDYLSLRLEDGKTNIYVNKKLFRQCKYLLLKIPISESETDEEINSIDEAIEKLNKTFNSRNNKSISISPEAQFWGHCSNLQAWYENSYNTCLSHRNLAFPLLKELTKAGDKSTKKIFKDEIAKRFAAGHITTIQFLLYNDYFNYLNKEEIECLLDESSLNLIESIINELKVLWEDCFKNYWKIINILEIMLFIALKYDKNYFFPIIEYLPEKMKKEFVKKLILYLNYKEFRKYKISYGKFFKFFEKIIEYLYNKYPNTVELFEGGYFNGIMSLDEMYSIGTIITN